MIILFMMQLLLCNDAVTTDLHDNDDIPANL